MQFAGRQEESYFTASVTDTPRTCLPWRIFRRRLRFHQPSKPSSSRTDLCLTESPSHDALYFRQIPRKFADSRLKQLANQISLDDSCFSNVQFSTLDPLLARRIIAKFLQDCRFTSHFGNKNFLPRYNLNALNEQQSCKITAFDVDNLTWNWVNVWYVRWIFYENYLHVFGEWHDEAVKNNFEISSEMLPKDFFHPDHFVRLIDTHRAERLGQRFCIQNSLVIVGTSWNTLPVAFSTCWQCTVNYCASHNLPMQSCNTTENIEQHTTIVSVLPLSLWFFPLSPTNYFSLATDAREYVTRSARREKGVDRVHMHCQLCHQSSVARDEFIGHTIDGVSAENAGDITPFPAWREPHVSRGLLCSSRRMSRTAGIRSTS